MRVEPATLIRVEHRTAEHAHVPRGHQHVDAGTLQAGGDGLVERARSRNEPGSITWVGTRCSSARCSALTPGRSDRTRVMCGPTAGSSRSACRLVPEPETSTATRPSMEAATVSVETSQQAADAASGSLGGSRAGGDHREEVSVLRRDDPGRGHQVPVLPQRPHRGRRRLPRRRRQPAEPDPTVCASRRCRRRAPPYPRTGTPRTSRRRPQRSTTLPGDTGADADDRSRSR